MTLSIVLWNVAPALTNPNGIRMNWNFPRGTENDNLGLSSLITHRYTPIPRGKIQLTEIMASSELVKHVVYIGQRVRIRDSLSV